SSKVPSNAYYDDHIIIRATTLVSRRTELARLARAATGGLISVEEAAVVLARSRPATARRLAELTRQGWLARVRRGLYQVMPLDAAPSRAPAMVEDAWVLASRVFRSEERRVGKE